MTSFGRASQEDSPAPRVVPVRSRPAPRAQALLAAVALLLVPTAAQADELTEEARRLDDMLHIVQRLGRAMEPMIADAEGTAAAYSDRDAERTRPILEVRDRAWFTHASALDQAGEGAGEARALELFDRLSSDAVGQELRDQGDSRAFRIEFRRAQRLDRPGNEDAAFAAYLDAAQRRSSTNEPLQKVGELGLRLGAQLEAALDWTGALTKYDEIESVIRDRVGAQEHPRPKLRQQRERILEDTGEVTVAWLGDAETLERVRGPKVDFRSARIELSPLDGQGRPPARTVTQFPFRVLNGRYRVKAQADAGAHEADLSVAASGAEAVLPTMLPQGMVLIPSVGGRPAFLIDRTEVASSEFRAYASSRGLSYWSPSAAPNEAAVGVKFEDAQGYARSVGKQLPSREQWSTAAFGRPGADRPRFPWGDSPGRDGVHGNFTSGAPARVDANPTGASSFGVLNLAGNAWEWLSDGWFIGGGFNIPDATLETERAAAEGSGIAPWTADFLRDAVPTYVVFDSLPVTQRQKFENYKALEVENLRAVGLRCVVPLGPPRRNP